MNKIVSIIIPVYNEEKNISLLYQALQPVLAQIAPRYDYEIIFVNDGSSDDSRVIIEHIARTDPKVLYLEFSRNFGKEIATTAGIEYAQGDCIIMLDADLQHPPQLIPDFLRHWESGANVVIGVRNNNANASMLRSAGSRVFYKVLNAIAEERVKCNSTDYRLLDRMVVNEFRRFKERNRITRGLIDWLGFEKAYIYFDTPQRQYGNPGYSYYKLTRLAIYTFVSQSLFPLKLSGYLGVIIIIFSGLLSLFIFVNKFIIGDYFHLGFSGPVLLIAFNLFLIGIILCCLGLIALYIGNIHTEIASRPLYVIKRKSAFEKGE